jgi:hypothetical protein
MNSLLKLACTVVLIAIERVEGPYFLSQAV